MSVSLHSFRLKIALLSGLTTGLLLVGSGLGLWQVTYHFNLARLDREIRNLGQANLDREHGPAHYQRFEDALTFVSGEDQPKSFLILVRGQAGEVLFISRNWPTNLSADTFPVLAGPVLRLGGEKNTNLRPAPAPPPPPPEEPPPDRLRPDQPRRGQPPRQDEPPLPQKVPRFETREVGGQSWRFGTMANPYNTLVLGMNIAQFTADMHGLRRGCLLGLPVILLLAGLSAWFLAQHALRPVTTLAQTAERVTARGLDQRIPAMSRDQEFNRLVTVFNEMMDRLEKSFRQATRFSADASHELKSPLARLQAELEHALQTAPSGSPQQEVYSSLLDEISRLKAIVEKLLLLSLADAGRLQLHCKPVSLTAMLENIIEDCRGQAPNLTVEQALAPDINVSADPDLLEQALQNLAGNAIKYNRDNGAIRFESTTAANRVTVRVTNTGSGIPAADRGRIFERFYRGDESRSARVDGVGLGLSLAREIIRAHGGELKLERSDEESTCFTAELPAISEPARQQQIVA